jgi:hypothetical protein
LALVKPSFAVVIVIVVVVVVVVGGEGCSFPRDARAGGRRGGWGG